MLHLEVFELFPVGENEPEVEVARQLALWSAEYVFEDLISCRRTGQKI